MSAYRAMACRVSCVDVGVGATQVAASRHERSDVGKQRQYEEHLSIVV